MPARRYSAEKILGSDKARSQPDGCILWTGSHDKDGYAVFGNDGGTRRLVRRLWIELRGPISPAMEPDHLCRTTGCINLDHVEVVTRAVNLARSNCVSAVNARKTHCIHGHEFTPANTYTTPDGSRACRTCGREATRLWQARRR